MASKSSQPNRYRKGKELQLGDLVAVKWQGKTPVEFSAIVSIEQVDASTVGQSGGRQYRAKLVNGRGVVATGAEFIEGQY
jgi:hypothetical protein